MERLAFAYPDEFSTDADTPPLPSLIPDILVSQPSRSNKKSKDRSWVVDSHFLMVFRVTIRRPKLPGPKKIITLQPWIGRIIAHGIN